MVVALIFHWHFASNHTILDFFSAFAINESLCNLEHFGFELVWFGRRKFKPLNKFEFRVFDLLKIKVIMILNSTHCGFYAWARRCRFSPRVWLPIDELLVEDVRLLL